MEYAINAHYSEQDKVKVKIKHFIPGVNSETSNPFITLELNDISFFCNEEQIHEIKRQFDVRYNELFPPDKK
jgi:hypothetical protein